MTDESNSLYQATSVHCSKVKYSSRQSDQRIATRPSAAMQFFTTVCLLGSLFCQVLASSNQEHFGDQYFLASTIRDVLKDNQVIGDVLKDFEPSWYLDMAYPKHHEAVLLGNDIPVKHVQQRPAFTFHPIRPVLDEADKTFTIALTDPDAKSRKNPKWSEMCHWLITNLTSTSASTSFDFPDILKEDGELKGYKPPGPPPKTGPHRYVFVLLQGNGTALKGPEERQHWGYGKTRQGVQRWADENGLEVVGANFFFAQDKKQK